MPFFQIIVWLTCCEVLLLGLFSFNYVTLRAGWKMTIIFQGKIVIILAFFPVNVLVKNQNKSGVGEVVRGRD